MHGSWRSEDANGNHIAEASSKHPNVENIKAYMPEAFGTHHSKMIVLFCHNEVAQVVITTGNFIERDWSMSQAFWCSPELTWLKWLPGRSGDGDMRIGYGGRFKHDLLTYFKAYGSKLDPLHSQLGEYCFDDVRGALITSVPSKIRPASVTSDSPVWGLSALQRVLRKISVPSNKQAHTVIQISSVASVGEKWLTDTLFPTLSVSAQTSVTAAPSSKHYIIFPTPNEIRHSISGYGSGSSIHMKISTPAQQRQLDFLRPGLCHWGPAKPTAAPSESSTKQVQKSPTNEACKTGKAARHPAAPHIKTYTRFSDSSMQTIDWAMMTSANLSTQAWGSLTKEGEMRICSYEIGVVFWPALWDERGRKATMVPTFGSDTPTDADRPAGDEAEGTTSAETKGKGREDIERPSSPNPADDGHLGEESLKEKAFMEECLRRLKEEDLKEEGPKEEDLNEKGLKEEGMKEGGLKEEKRKEKSSGEGGQKAEDLLVGWRMPYDLPLYPYQAGEDPWCASIAYKEKDWMGKGWPGQG